MKPIHYTLRVNVTTTVLSFFTSLTLSAGTLHVWPDSPSPGPPYVSWETAAHTIQEAVDAALAGDIVLVTNGVYATGGRAVFGTMTNRVAVDKPLTVQSVNGPAVTLIRGAGNSRCAYVGTNAVVSGFTLTEGRTQESGDPLKERSGGGAWAEASGLLTNCVLSSNWAWTSGAGVFGGILRNCTIGTNQSEWGGGAGGRSSTLYHCILTGNRAHTDGGGGGAFECTLYDCELRGNYSISRGGGAASSTLYRCLLVDNSVIGAEGSSGGGAWSCVLYECTLTRNKVESPWDGYGGGAIGSTLYRCTLSGNSVSGVDYADGGGVSRCTVDESILSANSVSARKSYSIGAGAHGSTLRNCLLAGNVATGTSYGDQYPEVIGGGASSCKLTNCTVVGNSVMGQGFLARGGGVYFSTLQNCIVFDNAAPTNSEYLNSTFSYSCTTPLPDAGIGNITSVPAFVNPATTNYHLAAGSPCIDAGLNLGTVITNDLDGTLRPLDGNGDGMVAFDIGAYEYSNESPPTIVAQPLSRTNVVGSSLMLAVRATGLDPLAYQWFKDSTALPGATQRTYVLTDVQLADAGTYAVRVSHGTGFVVSSNAVVTVLPAELPSVIAGPIVNPTNGHKYYLLAQSTWVEAEGAAQALGGHLATVRNATEQEWVFTQFSTWGGQERILWIGLHDADPVNNATNAVDRRAEFVWSSGEPVIYANWNPGEPNNYRERGEYYVHTLPPTDPAGPGAWVDAWDVDFNGRPLHGVAEVLSQPTARPHYVNAVSPTPTAPYLTWEAAARTIQDAVDAAVAGDEIIVTNGVYAIGGRAVGTNILVNRVAVDKPLTLRSVNGPQFTIIQGAKAPDGGNGDGIRCVYLADQSTLSGFTLTNGATRGSGNLERDLSGGGVWCDSGSAIISNCLVTGNSAVMGGGTSGGTLSYCTLSGNSAVSGAGAFRAAALRDCTLTGNTASDVGGGVSASTLSNCTLLGNSAERFGGGASGGSLYNCGVISNSVRVGGGGGVASATLQNCTLVGNSGGEGGGARESTLSNCTLASNHGGSGGGTYRGTLTNCTLLDNSGYQGGAAYLGTLYNCTLKSNSAIEGDGVYRGILYNCLLVGNSNEGVWGSTLYNCTLAGNAVSGDDLHPNLLRNCIVYQSGGPGPFDSWEYCFTNEPAFVNATAGNYHLRPDSPCIDAGMNLSAVVTNDLDGNLRPLDGNGDSIAAFDIGAYEFDPRTVVPTNWFLRYGLDPADPNVLAGNPDQDAFSTYQEWVADTDPTNAQSFFHIEAITVGSPVNVFFQSSSNRLYTLHSTTNVVSAIWPNVPGQIDVRGNGGIDALTDVTNGTPKFYKLGVRVP